MSKVDIDHFLTEAKKAFSDQLWQLNLDNFSKAKKYLFELVKVIRITFESFAKRRMGFQCVALSYFGALSIIPLIALTFTVTGGLGIADKVNNLIITLLPTDPTIIKQMTEKATNIIDSARSGAVGLVSALLFIWTIVWLMYQVERVFNNAWGIRKVPRNVVKRFSLHIGIVLILPFVIILFCGGMLFYSNISSAIGINFKEFTSAAKLLGWFIFYILAVFTLSLMYKWIPATVVKYKTAFEAALIIAVFFTGFQYFYLETQLFVSRLNKVYGIIAAIPLFLIWMNLSWQIVIYGAMLNYGLQNRDTYHLISELDEFE